MRQLRQDVAGTGSQVEAHGVADAVIKSAGSLTAEERSQVNRAATDALQARTLRQFSEDDPEVRTAMGKAAYLLPNRPRDYKRFVNEMRARLAPYE